MLKVFLSSSLCILAVLLSGCSSPQKVSGVCKSCKPYYVRDEWHYPQEHYDYDEIGLASWYGPKFHGKPKAHGEIYNQFEMTAAHKTLPIPTIAKVTNLDTGKNIEVLIDDRGPYVYKGRIIDLSFAAAKELGVYKKGTAKVRVTALEEKSRRFSDHLTAYKKAKCPKGRRWINVYHDEITQGKMELAPTIYKYTDQSQKLAPQILKKQGTSSFKKKTEVDPLSDMIKPLLSPKPKLQEISASKKKNRDVDSLLEAFSQDKKRKKRLLVKTKVDRKKYPVLDQKVRRLSFDKKKNLKRGI